jgi:hypothetical protein
MNERIGYDELLESRVRQLREIDERLEAIEKECRNGGDQHTAWKLSHQLRVEISVMIARAEAESEAF